MSRLCCFHIKSAKGFLETSSPFVMIEIQAVRVYMQKSSPYANGMVTWDYHCLAVIKSRERFARALSLSLSFRGFFLLVDGLFTIWIPGSIFRAISTSIVNARSLILLTGSICSVSNGSVCLNWRKQDVQGCIEGRLFPGNTNLYFCNSIFFLLLKLFFLLKEDSLFLFIFLFTKKSMIFSRWGRLLRQIDHT